VNAWECMGVYGNACHSCEMSENAREWHGSVWEMHVTPVKCLMSWNARHSGEMSVSVHGNVRECTGMHRDALACHSCEMSWNVRECTGMHVTLVKCLGMHGNACHSCEMSGNVWECLGMHGSAWECMGVYGNACHSCEMSGNVQECMGMHGNACALA
jgi:hypothetical protein